MAQILGAVRRRPLITFFALAYALSWWPAILYAFDLLPQPIAGFGPFLAAVVVLAITLPPTPQTGDEGFRGDEHTSTKEGV